MFYPLMIASVLAYTVQGTLLATYFRRYDLLTVVALRGISLLIVMAPLLFFLRDGAWADISAVGWSLAGACTAAAAANFCAGAALRNLAIGVASALTLSLTAIFTALSGLLIMSERLSMGQGLFALILILVVTILALSKGGTPRPDAKPLLGALASVACGLLMATALTNLVQVTRRVDPLFAAWAWEGGIGLVAGAALIVRQALTPKRRGQPLWPRPGVWINIGLVSSPTLIGTGCYALATQSGGIALASAILSTIMVGSTIMAHLLYHEHLSRLQWLLIAIACATVIGLRLT